MDEPTELVTTVTVVTVVTAVTFARLVVASAWRTVEIGHEAARATLLEYHSRRSSD